MKGHAHPNACDPCVLISFSLCVLRVLCVSVVNPYEPTAHHGDTENTEYAQRILDSTRVTLRLVLIR
jgi:hypothetical protein